MFDIPRLQGLPFGEQHGERWLDMAAWPYFEALGYTLEEALAMINSLSDHRFTHLAHILHPTINKYLESEWLDRVVAAALEWMEEGE